MTTPTTKRFSRICNKEENHVLSGLNAVAFLPQAQGFFWQKNIGVDTNDEKFL